MRKHIFAFAEDEKQRVNNSIDFDLAVSNSNVFKIKTLKIEAPKFFLQNVRTRKVDYFLRIQNGPKV